MTDLPKYVTLEEFRTMERIAKRSSLRNTIILRLMYLSGLCPGEVQVLIVSDFKEGDYLVIRANKEPQARRVKIDETTMKYLKQYAEEKKLSEYSAIFRSRKRKRVTPKIGLRQKTYWRPISDRQIRDLVKKYAEEAGILNWEKVSPMSLRHGFAVRALERGVPPYLLARYLGLHPHKRILKTYTEMAETLADRVAEYIFGQEEQDEDEQEDPTLRTGKEGGRETARHRDPWSHRYRRARLQDPTEGGDKTSDQTNQSLVENDQIESEGDDCDA